ncbi:DUF4019 domain-containing protein [Dyella sp. M7H15-1]|uniref:DUF4019 domain-containing protein n=1 Tax=Dyella sp. M7H15-1 TaxID=2501295 RepID=UPI00100509C9|nr:DUF4019 domain-containing protein [Dyella sp. M7H15-1]QAU24150.1 DUF4019 domain-containing protein [Dyella sp. M7H15-1]
MTLSTINQPSLSGRLIRGCILSVALLGAGSAFAQQAPSGLEKAIATAGKWAAQADANQADAMWKASAPAMQSNVNQANWTKYIGEVRKQAGAQQSRSWYAVTKVDNPQGMPAGEYLNVVYATKFANAATVETVSMAKSGSNWQPIGYVVRPAEQTKPNAEAQKPAASK